MNKTEHALQVKEREMNTWENAFEVFVEGAEVHGEEAVERAIKIMKAIDKELTEVFLFPDQEKAIQETKEARSERKMYERNLREVEETGKVTVREYYRAFNLKQMLEAQGKTAKIKSHFGRLYTVRVVA